MNARTPAISQATGQRREPRAGEGHVLTIFQEVLWELVQLFAYRSSIIWPHQTQGRLRRSRSQVMKFVWWERRWVGLFESQLTHFIFFSPFQLKLSLCAASLCPGSTLWQYPITAPPTMVCCYMVPSLLQLYYLGPKFRGFFLSYGPGKGYAETFRISPLFPRTQIGKHFL